MGEATRVEGRGFATKLRRMHTAAEKPGIDMAPLSARLDQRRRTHARVSDHLTGLSDAELEALLAESPGWRDHAHGGQSGVVEVEGARVFVKKVALTELELLEENRGATANLFGLPLFYQYGVGSAGFGAWRELEAYVRASGWVLSGECPYFPLLHHWRVLPRPPAPMSDERRERLEWFVSYWEASDAIRARLEAIAGAPASIVLFLEHVPQTLDAWLKDGLGEAGLKPAKEAAILRVHDQLHAAAAFMNARGMLHFDLHAWNVLADDEQIYAADFGLALCEDFDLSPAEREFYVVHHAYDRAYVDWAFAAWLTGGEAPPVLTPAVATRVERCAPVAAVLGGFFQALREETKTTPYPSGALEAALAAAAR